MLQPCVLSLSLSIGFKLLDCMYEEPQKSSVKWNQDGIIERFQSFEKYPNINILDFKAHRVTILPGNALPLASFLLLVAHFREGPHVHMLPVTH